MHTMHDDVEANAVARVYFIVAGVSKAAVKSCKETCAEFLARNTVPYRSCCGIPDEAFRMHMSWCGCQALSEHSFHRTKLY